MTLRNGDAWDLACGAEAARDAWLEGLQASSVADGSIEDHQSAPPQPWGDPASCEIFGEHGTFGFLKCANCGVPKARHWAAARPCAIRKEGWLMVRKRRDSTVVGGSNWKRRYARLAGSELRWFRSPDAPEADARHVIDAGAGLARCAAPPQPGAVAQFLVVLASGSRLNLGGATTAEAEEWLTALLQAQTWAVAQRKDRAILAERAASRDPSLDDTAKALRAKADAAPAPKIGAFDDRGAASRFAKLAQRLESADARGFGPRAGAETQGVGAFESLFGYSRGRRRG